MQRWISRNPAAQLTLLGTRIGAKAAKAVLMSAAAGRLTPEILSEALQSSSTIRGHVQREAVKLLMVRVSLRTPQQLQWLLQLVGDCIGGVSLNGAISSLTQRSLLYQVANFGLRGSAASAITTAAVQVGVTTCTLVTTNAAFWRKGNCKMSLRQYRYELLTSFYTGVSSVAGGAAGAAVGSLMLPGVGTAFGSVLCSVGAGYIPGYLRDKRGPDDCRRQQAEELQQFTPLQMQDTPEGVVLMYKEELIEMTPPVPTTKRTSVAFSSSIGEAGLSQYSSTSTGAVIMSSGSEVNSEEGEVVWLDFERAAKTPAVTTITTPDEQQHRCTYVSIVTKKEAAEFASQTASSVSTSASSLESVEENRAVGVRGFLRFSSFSSAQMTNMTAAAEAEKAALLSATSSFADLEEEEGLRAAAAAATATATAAATAVAAGDGSIGNDRAERFQGHAKLIVVTTEDELEAEVARFGGEDDLILVFAEGNIT